jgi:isopentenyl diphosphate isomerase/L-lactate dehydrogenase-like FMN-dependent dehydrogenase
MPPKKWLAIALVLGAIAALIGVPAITALALGHPERFEYYVKALEYALAGLGTTLKANLDAFTEYLKTVVDLFVKAVTT